VNFLLTCPLFQRDHEWIQGLANRLIQSINAQVEHVVRNGDVSGYPGCVNLSFSYVEGESLLMALKVRAARPLAYGNGIDVFSPEGHCSLIRQCLYISVVGAILCLTSPGYENPAEYFVSLIFSQALPRIWLILLSDLVLADLLPRLKSISL